jgi:hypothetical protein
MFVTETAEKIIQMKINMNLWYYKKYHIMTISDVCRCKYLLCHKLSTRYLRLSMRFMLAVTI